MTEGTKHSSSSRKLSQMVDQEVVEAFKLFDRDKDGKVSQQEIRELISSMGGDPSCPHVQDLLRSSETASLDMSHFMRLWKTFKASVGEDEDETEDDIRSAFRVYDIDGDGYITKEEMVQVMTRMGFVSNKEEEAAKCLKEMDLDGDGRVSYAEFVVKWKVT